MSQQCKIDTNVWKRNKRKFAKDAKDLYEEELFECSDLPTFPFPKRVAGNESFSTLFDPITQDEPFPCNTGNTSEEIEVCFSAPTDNTVPAAPITVHPEEENLLSEVLCLHVEKENLDSECDEEDYFESIDPEELSDLRTLFDDSEANSNDSLLKADLAIWSLQHKIGRNALTDLLHILHKHNHPNLPLSSKTLLKTPRSTVKMLKPLGEGLFWFYGILVNLIPRLTENFLGKLNGNIVAIDIFIDGVSPYKSVKQFLWPICASLAGSKDVFIIGMWCGRTKEPGSLSLFLEDFIMEAKELMLGFTHLGHKLKLRIRNIIADAPARTWLKNVNQHGSYNSCERCTAVGQWICNRMTYHPREETSLRTDQSLQSQSDHRYHKGPTPLTKLENFSLISQMPLEPMHLLFLGIMRRILLQLLGTKRNLCEYKFSDSLKSTVDNLSLYISQFYPNDFARKPRKWTDYALFKATEFRRILLYDGFIILKAKDVSRKVYYNYRLLACAIRILSDPSLVHDFLDDADTLLKKFISDSVSVYGQQFNVYNVHHLKHLADECRRHGDLDSFSAFKYENHLGVLKRLLHAPGRTLSQIVCRLLEEAANTPPTEVVQGEVEVSFPCELPSSLSHLGKGFESIFIPKCKILLKKHSFFLNIDKDIVQLTNIIKTQENFLLAGRKFGFKTNFFTTPFPSAALDIFKVDKLADKQLFTVNEVLKKCLVFPIPLEDNRPCSVTEGPCLALPMLHGGD
ncbi:1-deoxy-D-xylulose-5-phosphate synthase [Frankliniella fusca]|uniref:1-deoxy-D-xylulose-5-phosphate synthase n=1 Tax=Frankliniella fusca TaxID=407009 RepID=A0AAE1I594_9NEOP|nr:1-deoxy-D-xylulose-5-phosphate synthase [Frankliniella fusca]